MPTAILKARDSRLVKERGREPQPELGIPRAPSILDADAKKVWKQITPRLHAMGILAKIDANALARYCVTWCEWERAVRFIRENGTVYPLRDDNGDVKCVAQFPQVAIMHKTAAALLRMEQEFGMTPSARTRIEVPSWSSGKRPDDSPFDFEALPVIGTIGKSANDVS